MNEFFYDSYQLILIFLLPGAFLGAVYDVFRILRISRTENLSVSGAFFEKIRPKKPLLSGWRRFSNSKTARFADRFLVFAEDILFFLIVALTEMILFFHTNGGEIRIFCLLSSAIGFFLYRETVGRLIIAFAKQIIYLVRCFVYWCIYAIMIPLDFLKKQAAHLYRATIGRLYTVYINRKQSAYSERIKSTWIHAARNGFADKQGGKYERKTKEGTCT